MATIRLYHNPRCSKSREALELLRARGVEPEVVEYLRTAPSLEDLQTLQSALGAPVREFVRAGDALYAELGLDDASSDSELLDALAANPSLLQRPIAVRGTRAVVGRPPERVLELLD